ncbi:cytochrome P450 [Lophium mytilinum]|uniref:Cytochrome P450 n=1 Tax=Lophium mytilinum TaxID=390894 RepID=A0A6A6QPQ9_9PEZI|nr:cytochrome P450 [Lophium mytilinum]
MSSPDMVPELQRVLLSKEGLGVFAVSVVGLVIFLAVEAYKTNFQKIAGIPEVPNASPFIGHMGSLGGRLDKNDGTIYSEWATETGSDIYQIRVGNQRSVVVNSWALMKEFWINRSNTLIDRPHQPGFLDKLGVDLTGMPMTDQIRRCRQAAMKALGKPMWPKYYHLVEPSSVGLVKSLYTKGQNGEKPIDVYYYLRQVVFDLALSLTYGSRYGAVDDEFMKNFIKSINAISAVRSSTANFRHYVPLLRLIPERMNETVKAERTRAAHVEVLMKSLNERIAAGEDIDCIVTSLDDDKLSEEEIHGTCISLLQAAPDTVASGVYQTIAWLCTPSGQPTQAKVVKAILEAYGGDRDLAWRMAFREEKVPLLVSLYKETLRYYTFAPFATPRRTVKDIQYKDMFFPKGITMIMNAQQVNHDPEFFGADAMEFKPARFVGNDSPLPHVAFGSGSRICPAVAISNRLIYALVMRLLLAFEIKEIDGPGVRRPNIDPIHFSDVYNQLVAHPRFFDSCFVARDPAWLEIITSEV